MNEIQIYYAVSSNITNSLKSENIEIDPLVRLGYKTNNQLLNDVKKNTNFCRDEESINMIHLLSSMSSSILLYALLEDKVIGVLTFMFNKNIKGEKIINFDAICSPEEFKGLGVGNKLIDTLIRIGKFNDIKYINLECKGRVMKYYKNKFGFNVSEQNTTYDSDADSDDEGEPYYHMTLDLSQVSGGKRKRKRKPKRETKRNKKSKRKQTRRKQIRKN